MIADSGGSSISSSTYNSAEEGEYSNGANSAETEDISSSLNPFIFDDHHPFGSNSFKGSSKPAKVDEYLSSNSLSSPSTSPTPIMHLVNNNYTKLKKGE